jgi:hypothetical protein
MKIISAEIDIILIKLIRFFSTILVFLLILRLFNDVLIVNISPVVSLNDRKIGEKNSELLERSNLRQDLRTCL